MARYKNTFFLHLFATFLMIFIRSWLKRRARGRFRGSYFFMAFSPRKKKAAPGSNPAKFAEVPRKFEKNYLFPGRSYSTMIYGKILENYMKIRETYAPNGLITGHLSYREAIGSIGNEFAASIWGGLSPPRLSRASKMSKMCQKNCVTQFLR